MERGPESIARPRKVVPRRAGIQTGIDPAKQDVETDIDQIRYPATGCRGNLGAGRTHDPATVAPVRHSYFPCGRPAGKRPGATSQGTTTARKCPVTTAGSMAARCRA